MGSLIELSAVSSVVIALLLVFVFPLFLVLTVLLDAVICKLGYLDWLNGNNKFRRYIVSLLLYVFSLIGLIVLASGYTNQNAVYRDGNTIYIETVDKDVVSYDYTQVSDFMVTADVLSGISNRVHNCYRYYQSYPYNGNYGFNNYPSNFFIIQNNHSNSTQEYNFVVSIELKNGEHLKFIVNNMYKKQLYTALYNPENVHEYIVETEHSKAMTKLLNTSLVVLLILFAVPTVVHIYTLIEYLIFRVKYKKLNESDD
jgi:hypothetical protein